MQIYLDLLPEDRKVELKKKKLFRAVIFQEVKLLVPVVFFATVLAVINFNLKTQFEIAMSSRSQNDSQEQYQEMKIYEEKFREINQKVTTFSNFQGKHLHWSKFFLEFTRLVPQNVYLNSLTTKDYQISLSGKAKNRDDLLAFQEKLKSSQCFSGVEVPLSNLVSKQDVVFQIDLNVKPECLK